MSLLWIIFYTQTQKRTPELYDFEMGSYFALTSYGVVFRPYNCCCCCCFSRKVAFVKTTPVHLFCYEVIIPQSYEQRWILLVILITPWNETTSWFICEWHIHNNRQEELSLTSLAPVIHCTTMDRTCTLSYTPFTQGNTLISCAVLAVLFCFCFFSFWFFMFSFQFQLHTATDFTRCQLPH